MVEILLPVVIGGLIAILGGVWQSHMSLKNEIKREHRAKRETAYLELIDALLRIEVDDCVGEVDSVKFWPIYRNAQAKIWLYGSEQIRKLLQDFEWHLHMCWEDHEDKGAENKRMELIDAIRDELNIG